MLPDPRALAGRQRELDGARVRIGTLVERKRDKMLASPLAFLRGSAPLFYELLAAYPELGSGPDASGWIVGDLHVENFGAYRPSAEVSAPGAGVAPPRAVFDINDFDDATIGPCRVDVLRLCTSLLLGSRDLGLAGPLRVELAAALLLAHATALGGAEGEVDAPDCISGLLGRVRARTRKALLDGRTEHTSHGRRFERGARYQDLSPAIELEVRGAFEAYVASLPADERSEPAALEIVDTAFRIAGTGSLGCLRVAILTSGKGGAGGGFVFELKEQGAPSSSTLCTPPALGPVARVRTAAQLLVRHPPRMLGETRLGALPCLGRRLAPQEDRLDWSRVAPEELPALARHLGWLAGCAHRRGLSAPLSSMWSAADQRGLLDRAIQLAGLHEAIYLAYAAAP